MNNGIVYDVMRRTRHQYHYAVRSARKHDLENRKARRTRELAAELTGDRDPISRLPMHHVTNVSERHTKSSRTTIEACSAVMHFRRFFL